MRKWMQMPAARRLPPPFIGQWRQLTDVLHGITYSGDVLVHSAPGVTVFLANPCLWGRLMVNLGFCGWRASSCACPEMASRVVLTGVCIRSSSVRRLKGAPIFYACKVPLLCRQLLHNINENLQENCSKLISS
jgi:hypothetical protein